MHDIKLKVGDILVHKTKTIYMFKITEINQHIWYTWLSPEKYVDGISYTIISNHEEVLDVYRKLTKLEKAMK